MCEATDARHRIRRRTSYGHVRARPTEQLLAAPHGAADASPLVIAGRARHRGPTSGRKVMGAPTDIGSVRSQEVRPMARGSGTNGEPSPEELDPWTRDPRYLTWMAGHIGG